MSENTNGTAGQSPKKPAFIAYDITPLGGETPQEPEGLGVVFAHRDGNGFDALLDAFPLSGKLMLRKPGASTAGVTALAGGIPARRPDYFAYALSAKKDRDGKSRWRAVGWAYKHSDGEGLDVLYKAVPSNGRISLRLNDQQ